MTIRRRILERDGHVCRAQKDGCEGTAVEVHHVIPIEAGGTNEDDNLVSLCAACHYRYTTEQRQARADRMNAEKKEQARRNHPGRKDRSA
nr:HNH endonuclease signature motif containing protein [Mycobacterium intracellulare]